MCGEGAVCKAALHRPVCSCPDGFEGNAYDKCTKVGKIKRNFTLQIDLFSDQVKSGDEI